VLDSAPSSLATRLLLQDATAHLPAIYQTSPELLKGYLAQRALLAKMFNSTTSAITTTPFKGNGLSPAPFLKPLSRGTVTLNPIPDPVDSGDERGRKGGKGTGTGTGKELEPGKGGDLPLVQYNTLQNPLDSELILAIVRHTRRFWTTDPALSDAFAPITELLPGPQYQTDAEVLQKLRADRGIFWPSLAHPVGTCAMMPEGKGGCVDAELRVYGVRGLRVVDASVMPLIVGTALQATVYAVAEKAADIIKGGS
jgi:choline dehydrogenase-like flavoprotein